MIVKHRRPGASRDPAPLRERHWAPAFAGATLSVLPTLAFAADPAELAPDAGGLLRATLGLALVLALIFAVGWLMRRLAPARGGGTGPLRVVGSQALGARERVVLLEVGEQWLVVGVAPGNVRSLATLPRGELPPAPANPATAFAAMLARARGHREPPQS
jgi:flagellar protein FliO/FliZ